MFDILYILTILLSLIVGFIISWYILKSKFDIQTNSLFNECNIKLESLNTQLTIEKEHNQEKINTLESSKIAMKQEFENLANKIFEQNRKKSNDNLSLVLQPFKDQIKSFSTRVDEIYGEETKQRSSLLTEIKNLKDLNTQISSDAISLTKALKGENKTQGDWGEMVLSRILEQTGLREGIEYETQNNYTQDENKRLRPDVIIHLPNGKDIVIDSKVSLVSYLKYVNAIDKQEQKIAIDELIKSLKGHVKDLSSKRYENIKQIKTLDFVLMFIPIEAVFTLVASNDNEIFKLAFENNIMLVSPSTLFVTLRTIENIWRYEHQSNNAQLIAKKAAFLYDKFAGFVKDMDNIGSLLDRTQKAHGDAINKLSSGKGNLLRQSEYFIELGVKPKHKIKKTTFDNIEE